MAASAWEGLGLWFNGAGVARERCVKISRAQDSGKVFNLKGYRTSAEIAQEVSRRLALHPPAPAPVVPWRPRRIGSLSQRSDRMGSCRGYSAS